MRITAYTTIDLTRPTLAEGREAVTRRCIAVIGDIQPVMAVLFADPGMRNDITAFFDDMKLFLEPKLPAELETFLREWQALGRRPAA